jgi:hypothetical protein
MPHAILDQIKKELFIGEYKNQRPAFGKNFSIPRDKQWPTQFTTPQ